MKTLIVSLKRLLHSENIKPNILIYSTEDINSSNIIDVRIFIYNFHFPWPKFDNISEAIKIFHLFISHNENSITANPLNEKMRYLAVRVKIDSKSVLNTYPLYLFRKINPINISDIFQSVHKIFEERSEFFTNMNHLAYNTVQNIRICQNILLSSARWIKMFMSMRKKMIGWTIFNFRNLTKLVLKKQKANYGIIKQYKL
ncbi:hypothetical protein HZS_4413 [Henneguya salminicola]|nr:hypothetical protein HZS_4413 [Henneguya salminicola]